MTRFEEIRFAARRLARRPLLTLLAVATLAIGIGVNTAVFSLLEANVLRDLPLPNADRLAFVHEMDPDGDRSNLGFATYVDLADRVDSFAGVAASSARRPIFSDGDGAETLSSLAVTSTWLPTLGLEPLLGRGFLAEEDRPGAARVALLGHAFWLRHFGGDGAIVGRTIELNSTPYEIVGVLPRELDRLLGPGERGRLDLVTPLRYSADRPWACRTCRHLTVVARLQRTVSLEAARAELDAALAELRLAYPDDYAMGSGAVRPLKEAFTARARPLLTALTAGVGLVLLLAIANVASLLGARALERERELAIRRSLGASDRALLASTWTEATLVAGFGGAVGLAVASPLLRLLARLAPADLSRLDSVGVSAPVLGFAFGASVLAAIVSGVAPALVHLRSSARSTLAATGVAGFERRRHRLFRRLVVTELALAVVVVFAASLIGRSLDRLLGEDLGFRPDQVTVAEVSLTGDRYDEDEAAHAFFAGAADRLEAIPGIEAAGWTSQLPLGGNLDTYTLRFEDRPEMTLDEEPAADRYTVTPGYFRALGLRLVAGRFLAAGDRAGGELVVVISRSLAESIWPGGDPLGKRLRMSAKGAPWRTVVGVVDDVLHHGLDLPSEAQFYVPDAQWFFADRGRDLVVRSRLSFEETAARIRPVIRELEAGAPVERIRTMAEVVDTSTGGRRFAVRAWSSFALMALLLSAIGTYGLLARQVAQRRRELGVRSALGASPAELVGQVAAGTARMTLLAAAIALPLCWITGRLLQGQLWRIPTADPISLAAAIVVLALAAAMATVTPARRAARVDPATVLREE